jgi:hypothetical protein
MYVCMHGLMLKKTLVHLWWTILFKVYFHCTECDIRLEAVQMVRTRSKAYCFS